jgi:hypothetical protein
VPGSTSRYTSKSPGVRLDSGYALPRRDEVAEDRAVRLGVLPQRDVDVLDRDFYRYLTECLGALPLTGEVQTAPEIRVVKRAGRRP